MTQKEMGTLILWRLSRITNVCHASHAIYIFTTGKNIRVNNEMLSTGHQRVDCMSTQKKNTLLL